MTNQPEPFRTCVGCRQKRLKKDLIRLVKKEQQITFDRDKKMGGRGAYICPQKKCLLAARAGSRLERALRTNLDKEKWSELERNFNKIVKNIGESG